MPPIGATVGVLDEVAIPTLVCMLEESRRVIDVVVWVGVDACQDPATSVSVVHDELVISPVVVAANFSVIAGEPFESWEDRSLGDVVASSVPTLLSVLEESRVATDSEDLLSVAEADACLGPITSASVTDAELIIPSLVVTVGSNRSVAVTEVSLSLSPLLLHSGGPSVSRVEGRLCVELLRVATGVKLCGMVDDTTRSVDAMVVDSFAARGELETTEGSCSVRVVIVAVVSEEAGEPSLIDVVY